MGQSGEAASGPVRFGVFEFEKRAGELRKNGSKLRIEGQPLQILAMLLERPGQVVSREELQQRLWPADTFVSFEQGINTGIRRLREVLDDSATSPRYIETLPRRGYRFIYPLNGNAADQARTQRRTRLLMVAASLLTLCILAAALLNIPALRQQVWGKPAAIHSIAVLPLDNLSGEQEEYVIDGLHDELITELAQLDLQVPSRTSVRRYKGNSDLKRVARELNVDAVLEASVQRVGNHYIVNAQLIDASTDRHLWARTFERDERGLQSLPPEIVLTAAKQVPLRISRQQEIRLLNRRGVDPEVYKLVLKGNYYEGKWTRENLEKAIDQFRQAVELDPTYAPAWRGIGYCYHRMASLQMLAPRDAYPKAEAAISKALELDASLADAHKVLGQIKLVYERDWDGAEREAAIAQSLDPDWAGDSLTPIARGRFDEGIRIAKTAVERKPLGAAASLVLGWAYFEAGRYDDSISQLNKTLELDPRNPYPYFELGWNYVKKGQCSEAIAACEKGRQLREKQSGGEVGPGEWRCGWTYASCGRSAEALANLQQSEQWRKTRPGAGALVYDALGDHERALQLILKAEQEGTPVTEYYVCRKCSDKLFNDPRFQEFRRRIGPPEARKNPETRSARLNGKPGRP